MGTMGTMPIPAFPSQYLHIDHITGMERIEEFNEILVVHDCFSKGTFLEPAIATDSAETTWLRLMDVIPRIGGLPPSHHFGSRF